MFERPTEEERPFVQAICATPADLAPRLVFADWLEEQGDPRGEYLRASVTIEQAIERLGWGFAFAHWRECLPLVLNDPEFDDTIAKVQDWPPSVTAMFPKSLLSCIARAFRCGGFVENVVLDSRTFRDQGVVLRRMVPFRGAVMNRNGYAVGGKPFAKQTADMWRGVERIAVPVVARSGAYDSPPFGSDWNAIRFARSVVDLDALAVHVSSGADLRHVFPFLVERPVRSLLILSDEDVPMQGRGGLCEEWSPPDLRCLGLPRSSTLDIAGLASWTGLANLRLLDVSQIEFREADWAALTRSTYRRDDLIVLHRQADRRCLTRLNVTETKDLGKHRWNSFPVLESVFDF